MPSMPCPEGGALTLITRAIATPGADIGETHHMVALEVTDSGSSWTKQRRRQCLEPFFTTKGERGTGMGLAMVYGMVQRHSAELPIDSTPGIGTTVTLPVRQRRS
ncbi:MAG: ATP-binding protein [Steroidobacteraceae bacterium]